MKKGEKKKEKKILLVEDDSTYLSLLTRLMKELGVTQFKAVPTAEKAQALLEKENYDILMSDVILPGMNGYELAKFAKIKNQKIQILLTTGYATDLSRFDLVGLQCHLLHKPYHSLTDVCILLRRLVNGEDLFNGMDEDSFSENIDNPLITEWTL